MITQSHICFVHKSTTHHLNPYRTNYNTQTHSEESVCVQFDANSMNVILWEQQQQPTAEEQDQQQEEGGQEEEEELMEPRPMEEMEEENDDDNDVGENDNAGRSRLRRHR